MIRHRDWRFVETIPCTEVLANEPVDIQHYRFSNGRSVYIKRQTHLNNWFAASADLENWMPLEFHNREHGHITGVYHALFPDTRSEANMI